jgi:Uma2 family endonuclease
MTAAAKSAFSPKTRVSLKKTPVPDYLIREVINGEPWYYRGYRDVLNGTKKPEEIMACSTLQSVVVNYLNAKLWHHLEDEPYWVMSNEIGNNLSKKTKSAYDVAVFDKKTLPASQVDDHYANVPPVLVVEVDVKVETEKLLPPDLIFQIKTRKLLEFGVKKVVWFFTKNQSVLIAEAGKEWIFDNWNRDVELWDGLKVNVPKYLTKQGISVVDEPFE